MTGDCSAREAVWYEVVFYVRYDITVQYIFIKYKYESRVFFMYIFVPYSYQLR